MLTKSQQLVYKIIDELEKVEDKTKLAKLQYLADFIHFAFHDNFVSGKEIVYTKQKQGPLASTLTNDLEALKEKKIIEENPAFSYKIKKTAQINLTPEEIKTVQYVCNKYGKLNWRDLVSISHEQEPYLSAAEGGVIESFTAYNLIDDHEQEYNAISCRS
ncbi:MAG: SocA family protein [Candidatus Melainabacteria bacterium]|nr:SocA family protein [Candidatus Melainabacteria bacterium]